MATERIQIIVSTSGTVTVKREIESIGDAGKKASTGISLLKSALAGIGTIAAASALISYSDSATRLSNTLRNAGLEGQKFTDAQNMIYSAAIKNGQQAEALSVVYQKLVTTQKDLGINSKQVDQAFTGIAAAMKLSTAGTSAQAGALQQLSQLLGGTVIQAQEYNSLIDGAFPLVQAAARGIDGMNGSVSKLTQTIKEGGFSTKVFFEGLLKGLKETEATAARAPLTIGQAWVSLQTALTQTIGSFNESTGVFSALASAIKFVADNIRFFIAALIPLGIALVYLAGQAVIGLTIAAFQSMALTLTTVLIPALVRFNLLLVSNPLVLLATALVLVIGYFVVWGNGIENIKVALAAVVAYSQTFTQTLIKGVAAIIGLFVSLENWIRSKVISAFASLVKAGMAFNELFAKGLEKIIGLFVSFYDWIRNKSVAAINFLIKTGQSFVELMANGISNLIEWFGKLVAVLRSTVASAFNSVFGGIINLVNKVISVVRALIEMLKTAVNLKAALGGGGGAGAGAGAGGGAGGGGAGRTGFNDGGSFKVGGTGAGRDSTPVSFNANRGEQVTIETRKQQRQAANGNNAGETNVQVPVAITNVFDPAMIPIGLNTNAGQRAIVNAIMANREEINNALGVA